MLLYLDDSKHFRKGVLGGGHGGQEAEEMVSRRIREHLEIVGRVLWAQTRGSESPSSASPLHSRGYSESLDAGEPLSAKPSDEPKSSKALV